MRRPENSIHDGSPKLLALEILVEVPESRRIRSASVELEKNVHFAQGARQGLYAALGTDPLSV